MVRYFAGGRDEAIAVRLQWHTIPVIFNLYLLNCCFSYFYLFIYFLQIFFTLLGYTLSYMMEDWLKSAAEEAKMEKALKKVTEATTREKNTAVEKSKERARVVEGA